jgi:tetratricopeptide (TPR) repeat protein
VKSIDELAAILPRRRDDEPPELRAQIVKELQDHLECAYQRELLRTGDETRAAQRVQEQFGDARQLARNLWFEAMQEKIMSQRILIGLSVSLAIACLATGGFALRIAQQTAEASAAATKALVDQGQETNQALLRALDRLALKPDLVQAPVPENVEEGEIRLKLVKGVPGGPPAAGYEINFNRGNAVGLSNELGEFVIEKARTGGYTLGVTTPWGETASPWNPTTYFQFSKGKNAITDEIVCPEAPRDEIDVTLDVQWPDDLRGEHLGVLLHWSKTREIAGKEWSLATLPNEESASAIVTTDGMILRNITGWREVGQRSDLPLIDFPDAHAIPRTTIHWRGSEFQISIIGVAIPENNETYRLVRIERDPTDDVDPAVIRAQLTPDRADQHIGLPIPLETAANVRLAMGRSFDLTAKAPKNLRRETPDDKPDPETIDKRIAVLTNEMQNLRGWDGQKFCERSLLWHDKGDFAKAIEDISEAIRGRPQDANYYVIRSSLWHEMQEFEKELDDLAVVKNLKPKDKTAYDRRAEIWEQKGEFQKAIEEYTTLIQHDRDNPDLYIARGHLSQKAHSPANALLDYIEALARGPRWPDAHSNLAWFFATATDPKYRNAKRSLKLATEACRLSEWRDWNALNALAAAYAETGDFALAAAWQAKVLEMRGKVFIKSRDTEIKSAELRLAEYKADKPWRDPE